MEFYRQEYWSGLPFPTSRPRDRTAFLGSPALAGGFFTTKTTWEALCTKEFLILHYLQRIPQLRDLALLRSEVHHCRLQGQYNRGPMVCTQVIQHISGDTWVLNPGPQNPSPVLSLSLKVISKVLLDLNPFNYSKSKKPWKIPCFHLPSRSLQKETQFSSIAQSCLTLCDLMDCSMPGLPVHHQLLEFTQTHVHWVSDAIQTFRPLSSPSPPTFNFS